MTEPDLPSPIVIALEDASSSDALWCIAQYFAELDQRFDGGFDAGVVLTADAHEVTPPAGAFLVARREKRPVGCAALKGTGPGVADIKRMWVSREHRGTGLGRRLLVALEDQARRLGFRTVRLETNRSLHEAQALYRSHGYVEVEPFNDEPHAHLWFAKDLTA